MDEESKRLTLHGLPLYGPPVPPEGACLFLLRAWENRPLGEPSAFICGRPEPPLLIWVLPQAAIAIDNHQCQTRPYKIAPESAAALGMIPPAPYDYWGTCDCMGELIGD